MSTKLWKENIIWIFTEGEGDGIESRLPFKIFSTSSTFSLLLLSIIFRLPELSKYIEQWENAVDGEETTVSINQVNNLSALLEDVEIAWKALTLPILEPLTTDMLQKVTKIVKGKIFMKKQVFRFEGPYPIVVCTC